MPRRTRECTTVRAEKRTHLAQQTASAALGDQLVASQRHTHRHDCRRAVRLQNIGVVRLRRRVAVAVVEHGVVRLVDPLPQNHVERLRITHRYSTNGGSGQKHSDLDGNVRGNEARHSSDRVDDLVGLRVLHGLDDVASVPQLLVRILVLSSLPGLNLGDGLVVGLLAKNDLSSRHFQDSTNLPEVATDHIVLHTAPVGRLIIQTLI